MTDKIKEQINQIRLDGEVNMFEYNSVQRIAYEREYFELVCYIEEHVKEYINYILTGSAEVSA